MTPYLNTMSNVLGGESSKSPQSNETIYLPIPNDHSPHFPTLNLSSSHFFSLASASGVFKKCSSGVLDNDEFADKPGGKYSFVVSALSYRVGEGAYVVYWMSVIWVIGVMFPISKFLH
jgi:hypothetical protein